MAWRSQRFSATTMGFAAMCLLAAAVDAQTRTVQISRVRYADPTIRQLLEEGARRSPTFGRLVDTIQASDGIVYIDIGSCGSVFVHGCLLHWIAVSGGVRFLRIRVDVRGRSCGAVIGSIAHELQHAAEVLADPSVTKASNIRSLFERIGVASKKGDGDFETLAARDAGLRGEQEYAEASSSNRRHETGARSARPNDSGLECNRQGGLR